MIRDKFRKCAEGCEFYLQVSSNTVHYASLRCREHGYIQWINYDQYSELADLGVSTLTPYTQESGSH